MFRLLTILISIPFLLAGQDSAEDYAAAVQLAANGKYAESVRIFRDIQDAGYNSSNLEYNLGTAYLHMDSIGKAILHLERARKSVPNDEQIRKNIEIARTRILEPVIPVTPFFLAEWVRRMNGSLSLGGWSLLGLLTLWVLCAGIIVKTRRIELNYVRAKNWMLIIAFVLSALSFVMAWTAYHRIYENDTAVLMADRTELKVGPDLLSTSYGTIYKGEKLVIRTELGDWVYVELLNKDLGWLQRDLVTRI